MDLGKWLRDRKDQAVRQWQDSVVLDAVSSGTKADQTRRASQGTEQTVRQRASDSYGGGFGGVVNRARDVLDANTQADNIKRQAASGLFENYQQQQNRLNDIVRGTQTDRSLPQQFAASGLREIGKFFGNAPGALGNMYGSVAQSENPIVEVARGLIPGMNTFANADRMTGHSASKDMQRQANDLTKQVESKINQNDLIGERQGENKWAVGLGSVAGQLPAQIATGGAGLVNTGVQMASDEYNKARAAGRDNDAALGIGTLQGVASAASEKFGVDKFLPGNGVGGNTLIKAGKRFLTEGGQEAEQQFIQNLVANKSYNPNQGLKDGVFESAVLGGIAGGAMSPMADIANIGTTPKPPTQLTPELQNKRNTLADGYTKAQDMGRPDLAQSIAQQIDQIDNPQPGTLREKIRSAKERIITPLNEQGSTDRFTQFGKDESTLPGDTVDPIEQLTQQNAIPNENLQRIDALNNTMVAASEAPKMKLPNDLKSKDVNETLDRNALRNKLMVEKSEATAPKTDPLESLKQEARTMYRGASKAEWDAVQKSGKFGKQEIGIGDPKGFFNNDVHTVGNKKYAENYAYTGGADGVVIEYKPTANKKMRGTSLEDTTDMGKVQEARGKGLDINDVQRVTDRNGNVIYEAGGSTYKPGSKVADGERVSVNTKQVRDANAKTLNIEEGGDLYEVRIKENNRGDVEFQRYDSNGNFMDTTTKAKLEKAFGKLSDEQLAEKSVYGNGKLQPTQSQPPKSPIESLKQEAKVSLPGVSDEKLTLYRGGNKTNAKQSSPDRAVYHADTAEYAGTYGKVSSKEVNGRVLNANSIQAYNRINEPLRKAIARHLPSEKWKKLTGQQQTEIEGWVNHTLEGERLSAQFNKPMPEVVKQAFDDLSIDYIRIPGDQFKGTVGRVGHQTEIIEIPKPKSQPPKSTQSTKSLNDFNGNPIKKGDTVEVETIMGTKTAKVVDVTDGRYPEVKYKLNEDLTVGMRDPIKAGTTLKTRPELINQDVPKPAKSQSTPTVAKKPFVPISQPVDNTPAIAKQVTSKKQQVDGKLPKVAETVVKPKTRKDIEQAGLDQETVTAKQYAETFGVTEAEAKQQLEQPEPVFNASATSKKNSKVLTDALKTDSKITKAVKSAQQNGKELNFYAKKDANGRSVGIETFNPKTHRIEAGFVVDSKGNVLGNHVKVDETGVQVNVGGDLVNMESIIGNPLEWGKTSKRTGEKKGKYKLSETMSRNIDNNAPTPEIANTTKRFLWSSKVKAEANMRTELDSEFSALNDRIKRTNKAKPFGVSKEQYKEDIFATLNGDKTDAQIKKEYAEKPAQAILAYKKETRTLYDSLLKRINSERVKFGQEPITPRKDYITHLQEMNQNKGFVTEVYGQMKNSFADEGMGKTRNGVPGDIAGRTENFKPISKYNPFLQQRTGTESLRDPFMAVQEYLQPALYNIHMTEPGARARAVETAFRTAEQLKAMDSKSVAKEMETTLEKYKKVSSDNAKLITGFQEYANAVAGKTQRFDRQVTDSSDAAAKGLKVWQGLQRIGGRGTILGNLSSVLAQPLNQVVGIADAGGINYAKGIAEYMGGDSQIDKSDFIRARETEATKPLRGTGEKILDAGSIPLQAVELASVKLMWHTQHQKALSDGYKGQEAVQQTDMNTERLVAGRGIADKPELYRSTVANGVYQYTLEVNAQNKAFWQDLDTKQKVKFMVAASATNALMGAITGFEPLPDFLKAIFETGKDFIDPEDDRNIARKLGGGIQRMGDEYAGMNPLISGVANILPQDVRKTVFGQESQLGRYAGGSAPVQVIKNTASAAKNLAQGKPKEAAYDAVRNVPFGNQIRKTTSAAEMLARGYAVDSSGKKTFDAPTSIAGKAQALAFGPNSSQSAQDYYDKSGDTKTKSQLTTDTKGNQTSKDDFETISKAAFSSTEGKKFMELKNEDERKAYANESADNRAMYNQYKSMQKAFNGGDKLLATGLDENSSKILQKYDRMETKAKEKVFNNNPGAEYEYELADYNNKKANGELSMVDEINQQQRLNKMKATKDFEKGYRDIYSGLSKTEIYDLITTNPQGKTIADKMLAIDDALVAAGEKSKFRDKYGNIKFDPNAKYARGGKGGKGSRGGKTAKDTSVAFSNSLQSSTLKRLNSLLAGTSKPVTGSKKVATSKPVLKKITVKA